MTNSIRILAIEGWPTLFAGGQERSLFEVLSWLRRRGVQITLAYEQEGDLVSEYEARGVRTFRIPTRTLILKAWRDPTSIFRFTWSCLRILGRHHRVDDRWTLIYVNQVNDLTLAVICGTILKIPVVCHLRVPRPHHLSRQYRWGLKRCTLLICNSWFTYQTYARAGIADDVIAMVHNGVDTGVFCPAGDAQNALLAERRERRLLYIGRIVPDKGIEILIKATALVRQHDPRIKLIVVGNAWGSPMAERYQASLRALAREKLGAAVEFLPATPDVVPHYRAADLTVLPSVWDEAFGRVIIESMACGIPCLASRGGGVPEILTDALKGLMFQKGDASDLASRIREYIDWRTADPGLSRLCRERVLARFAGATALDAVFGLLSAVQHR